MHISKAFDLFITDRRSYCASDTVDFYQENIQRFLSYVVDKDICNIEDVTSDVLKDYLISLRSLDIKNTSIKTYFRAINAFFSFLISNYYIPDFNYRIKLPKSDPDLVLPLSNSEVLLCTQVISQRFEFWQRNLLMFRLMLDCGLRSQEVRQLLRCHIFDDRIQIVDSKCNKSRVLPIPDVIKKLFILYDIDQFSPQDPILDLSENAIKNFFFKLKKRSGIPRIHAHLLRHTFATSYMFAHNNLEYLRLYMGHESYNITQHYIQLSSQCLLTHYDIYKISDVFL